MLSPGQGVAAAGDQVTDDPFSRSVPAEFVYSLRLPGTDDHFHRPSSVFVDHTHGEVLVGDAGIGRVVIFDSEGLYRFEFGFEDRLTSVTDLGVDSEGFIYVLGYSTGGSCVLRYDFDGVFLGQVSVEGIDMARMESMTLDDQDRLVLINREGLCSVVSPVGELIASFDTTVSLDIDTARGVVRGQPRATRGRLYLPLGSVGSVLEFDLANGELLQSIGVNGTEPGTLGFAVAVDVLPSGVIVVLDKMRFNVLCFSPSGRFLGEFGGMGFRDGWMYHPTLLAAVQEDQVVVGQLLDQRVQLLRVPDFVFEWLSHEPADGSDDDEGMERSPQSDSQQP